MSHDKINFHEESVDEMLDIKPSDKATLAEVRTAVQDLTEIFHEYLRDLQNNPVQE